jgi:hypothetical protein
MIKTMLLIAAALTAAAAPALAAEIKAGDVCQKKVAAFSWHECGRLPATGRLTFINTGTHEVTVFSTGTDPIHPFTKPFLGPACQDGGVGFEKCVINIQPNDRYALELGRGDYVYIARADGMWSDRTIAVTFEDVP